jgi:MFS family permease
MDSLGRIFGPLLGTFLLDIDLHLPYLAGGLLSLAAMLLLLRFRLLDRSAGQQVIGK